jgi:hypothetical protein
MLYSRLQTSSRRSKMGDALVLLLMASGLLVLFSGDAESVKVIVVRCLMTLALFGGAVVVWALMRAQ